MKKAQRSHIQVNKLDDGTLSIPHNLEFKHNEYKYVIDNEGNEYRLHKSPNGLLTIIEKEDEKGNWHWYLPDQLKDRIRALEEKYTKGHNSKKMK